MDSSSQNSSSIAAASYPSKSCWTYGDLPEISISAESPSRTITPCLPNPVLRCHNTGCTNSISTQQITPSCLANTSLSHSQSHKIVHQASSKDPITRTGQCTKSDTGQNLNHRWWALMVEICDGAVVQHVENTDSSKRLGDDVGENWGSGFGVHWGLATKYVVELGEWVDQNEDVGGLECGGIPEYHPC